MVVECAVDGKEIEVCRGAWVVAGSLTGDTREVGCCRPPMNAGGSGRMPRPRMPGSAARWGALCGMFGIHQ
jgi:hypothetical protein